MIDFDKIGTRIKEQRKYFHKISQEKMAEDLGMYQADISNIEKNKSGSGIADLFKLDQIAEYLGLPLETLLFGREVSGMPKYAGNTMQLKPSKKTMRASHEAILKKLTGQEKLGSGETWECGPYMLYSYFETQLLLQGEERNSLTKFHTYLFQGSELIGVAVSSSTTVLDHICQPRLVQLQKFIPWQILDVTDVLRTLNPYWALWTFSEDDARHRYAAPSFQRMMDLQENESDRPVLYIESAYVREDCRQHGLFRMYIDYLKSIYPGCILWLNIEPTAGEELENENTFESVYTISEIGQINLNAVIAEKVGFTIDPDPWHKKVKTLDPNGNAVIEERLVHKCAYFLPPEVRQILRSDKELVAEGRALQRVRQAEKERQFTTVAEICDLSYKNVSEQVLSSNHQKKPAPTQEEKHMKNYRITEVKFGQGEDGFCNGPIAGPSIAEAKFTAEDGESFYLSLADVDGAPNFYKTPESTFEKQIQMVEDDAFWEDLNNNCFIETGDYDEIFEKEDAEYFELYRYLIYLVCTSDKDAKTFIDRTEGKTISEITIPKTDLEL